MNTPTSDFDLKIVYIMPMDDLLAGKHFRNEEYKVRDPRTNDVRVDITYIEVANFIGQLKECNTNAYVQLFSPMVRFPAAMKPLVDELRAIAMENFSRGIKHSLLGIIKNTIARGQQNQPKRRKLCLRLLRTVESAMDAGKWTFDPVAEDVSEADLERYLVEFKNKVERSSLPEKPTAADKFDAFVVRLRRLVDSAERSAHLL